MWVPNLNQQSCDSREGGPGVNGKKYFQKSWFLRSGMKEYKQNTWVWWGKKVLLREGESLALPDERWRRGERRKKRVESFIRSFLYHLVLGFRERIHHYLVPLTCGLREGALWVRSRSSPKFSLTLTCLTRTLLRNTIWRGMVNRQAG
jgi:hypothetical protein